LRPPAHSRLRLEGKKIGPRPGGNITGLSLLGPELVPKRLELLKETLPNVSRVAVLREPDAFGERTTRDLLREIEAAAQGLGVTLRFVSVRGPDEFDRAFSAITTARADALLAVAGSVSPLAGRCCNRSRMISLL
jgi:ABC-type uncharacterized transport system substrate-binding protein